MLTWIKELIVDLLVWIVQGIIDLSYWGCLFVGIIAIYMYIAGKKDSAKYVPISYFIYFILQSLGQALKCLK